MKKLYIYVSLFFLLAIIFFSVNKLKEEKMVEVKETFDSLSVISNSCIKEINEENDKSKVLIYYPQTGYEVLDQEITNFIKGIYNDYNKENAEIGDNIPRQSQLLINFDCYEYKDYVSYVFNTSKDILMAHPDQHIHTINYDVKNNKIVTIKDLVGENPNLLNVLSKYTYENLSKEKSIIEYGSFDDLKNGTLPTEENFKNIAFTKTGLLILFEHYTVGPYVLGEFSVTVPYDKII